ncbi:MAG: hypothetical protein ACYDGR_06780 [Candidatus Dormibacteria bacterium]
MFVIMCFVHMLESQVVMSGVEMRQLGVVVLMLVSCGEVPPLVPLTRQAVVHHMRVSMGMIDRIVPMSGEIVRPALLGPGPGLGCFLGFLGKFVENWSDQVGVSHGESSKRHEASDYSGLDGVAPG